MSTPGSNEGHRWEIEIEIEIKIDGGVEWLGVLG